MKPLFFPTMRAVLAALSFLAAAEAHAYTKPGCKPVGPLDPWTITTERGVTVHCGESKIKRIAGLCAMFTVRIEGGKTWTAWANEDQPNTVRTFNRGELLLVGRFNLRLYTRAIKRKDLPTDMPPTAGLISELTEQERLQMPQCDDQPIWTSIVKQGADHLLVNVGQKDLANGKKQPPIQLKVRISDASVSRVTPYPGANVEPISSPITLPAPTPEPPKPEPVAAPTPPQPAVAKPDDRPTADPNFGKSPLKGYRPKSDSLFSCAHVPGAPALALLLVALRRRRSRR